MTRLVAILLLAVQYSLGATTFDVSADFSVEKNPNGPWAYNQLSRSIRIPPLSVRFSNSHGDVHAEKGFRGTLVGAP